MKGTRTTVSFPCLNTFDLVALIHSNEYPSVHRAVAWTCCTSHTLPSYKQPSFAIPDRTSAALSSGINLTVRLVLARAPTCLAGAFAKSYWPPVEAFAAARFDPPLVPPAFGGKASSFATAPFGFGFEP